MRAALLDYGMGNLWSVRRALERAGAKVETISRGEELGARFQLAVLPGVGAFGEAMRRLNASGLSQKIRKWIARGLPFLGLCLGMQLLLERSEESPGVKGLSAFRGEVKKLRGSARLPHLGWNEVRFRGGGGRSDFYFVHSYICAPREPKLVSAETFYGRKFPAALRAGRLLATQFHPEKSGAAGLELLGRYLEEIR